MSKVMSAAKRNRPLLGKTVLIIVNDSETSEKFRKAFLRSGCRTRRACDVSGAKRHLQVYKPSFIVMLEEDEDRSEFARWVHDAHHLVVEQVPFDTDPQSAIDSFVSRL